MPLPSDLPLCPLAFALGWFLGWLVAGGRVARESRPRSAEEKWQEGWSERHFAALAKGNCEQHELVLRGHVLACKWCPYAEDPRIAHRSPVQSLQPPPATTPADPSPESAVEALERHCGASEKCRHGVNREEGWCEPCFREEQRRRWGHSPHGYCDSPGRGY